MRHTLATDHDKFDTIPDINESTEPLRINQSFFSATKANLSSRPYFINPASANSIEALGIRITERNNSSIIDDSPLTFRINDSSPVRRDQRSLSGVQEEPSKSPINFSAYRLPRRSQSGVIDSTENHLIKTNYTDDTPVLIENAQNFQQMLENFSLVKARSATRFPAREAKETVHPEDVALGLCQSSIKRENRPEHQATFGTLHSIIHGHSKTARLFKRLVDAWRLKKRLDIAMDEKDKAIQKGISAADTLGSKKSLWKKLLHETINPENRYLIIWRFIFQVSVIYFCFNFPYRLCFDIDLFEKSTDSVLTIAVDVLFYIDILLTFFIAIRRNDGSLVWNKKLIAKNYLKTTLIIDIIAAIPHEYYSKWFSVLKLLRIIHLNSIFSYIRSIANLITPLFVKHLKAIVIAKFLASIATITIILSLVFNLSACIWVALGRLTYVGEQTWLDRVDKFGSKEQERDNNFDVYVDSLFQIVQTYTSVGYGTNTGVTSREYMFCLVILCFGILTFGFLFQKTKSITLLFNEAEIKENQEIEELDQWIQRLARGIIRRIGSVDEELFQMTRTTIMGIILNERRQKLIVDNPQYKYLDPHSQKIVLDVAFQKLRQRLHIFFQDMSNECAYEILTHVHSKFFMTNETIIRRGNPTKGIFFILEGSVALTGKSYMESFQRIMSNSYFGDNAFLERNESPFSFIAETDINCLFVKAEVFEKLCLKYPTDIQKLKMLAYERIKYFISQKKLSSERRRKKSNQEEERSMKSPINNERSPRPNNNSLSIPRLPLGQTESGKIFPIGDSHSPYNRFNRAANRRASDRRSSSQYLEWSPPKRGTPKRDSPFKRESKKDNGSLASLNFKDDISPSMGFKSRVELITIESNLPLITEENKENVKSEIFSLQDAEKVVVAQETLKYSDSESSGTSYVSGFTEEEEDEEPNKSDDDLDGTSSEGEDPLNRSDIFPVECGIQDLVETSEASEIVENLQERLVFLTTKLENLKRRIKHESQYLSRKVAVSQRKLLKG